MKKTLLWALLLVALLALLCAPAQAAGEPRYYFMVSVEDRTSDGNYDSCHNSMGEIRLYTKKQDGSDGPVWTAPVWDAEWDHRNQTMWYTLGCAGGSADRPESLGPDKAFSAFPTELVLYANDDGDRIYNRNKTYTSKERFTLWVSADGTHFEEVQHWDETATAGNLFGFNSRKYVDEDKMPALGIIKRIDITPDGEIPIPPQGGQDDIVHFDAVRTDQYGVEWYSTNAGTWYRLAEAHDGISIESDNGKLTVTSDAAVLSSNPRYSATLNVYTNMIDFALNRDPTTTRTITLVNPQYVLTYYSYDEPIAIYQLYYGTSWTHPDDIPVKTSDADYHYTFRGWGTPPSVTVTGT